MTLNSEAVQAKQLGTLLTEIYATRPQRILYLSADASVPYQKIVDVIDVTENLRTADVLPEPAELRHTDRMAVEVKLLTKSAIEKNCSQGCFNWAKEPIVFPAR